jgi:hypothetical protein
MGVDITVLVCRGQEVTEERHLGRAWHSRPLTTMAAEAVDFLQVEERPLRWSVSRAFSAGWKRSAYDLERWEGPIRVDVMRHLLDAAKLLGMTEYAATLWRDLLEELADHDQVLWTES